MVDFQQIVMKALKNLLNPGPLNVESSRHDGQGFGNAVVVLVGQNLRLRIVRDREETFADAADRSDPNNWFPLQRVIYAVGGSSPPPEGLLTPDEVAEIVEQYLSNLEKGLAPENVVQTRKRLAELERFAMKRLIDRAKRR